MKFSLGIIGTGNIFPAYLRTLQRSKQFHIVGIADGGSGSAKVRAEEFGLLAMSQDDLLQSDADIILCLTPPLSHYDIGMRALHADKHFFTEKPLAATFADGQALVQLAAKKSLRLGCAPDTFFGSAAQTVRALVDRLAVGTVRHGTAHFMAHGPDEWHPNPAFFYRAGAGPLLDVGVYYLTHLVHHLGPVNSVSGTAHTTHTERLISAGPNAGLRLAVEVPTHIVSQLTFTSGAHIVLTSSFDVWKHAHQPIELYCDGGSILVPDPNLFGGIVKTAQRDGPWQRVNDKRPHTTNQRGLGLIDMAHAIREQREHRCSAELALHVLEVMERAIIAAQTRQPQTLSTSCVRPAPL